MMKEEMTLYKKIEIEDSNMDPFVKTFCRLGIPKDVVEKFLEKNRDQVKTAEIALLIEDDETKMSDIIYQSMKIFDLDPITPHENFLVGYLVGQLIGKIKTLSDKNVQELINRT